MTGFINSVIFLAAAGGALLSSCVLARYSRRESILVFNLVGMASMPLLLAAPRLPLLVAGRVIQGVSMGGLSSVIPLVIKEYTPKELSGATGALNNVFIILGVIGANVWHAIGSV
jgi:major inositol transporter-like SP family MFS transporter